MQSDNYATSQATTHTNPDTQRALARLLIRVLTWASITLVCACGGADDGDAPPQVKNLDPGFPTITPLAETLEKTIDNYLAANQQPDAAGLSVLVRKDDQVVYWKSVGMADIPQGIAITHHTGFHLGALSEPFTAIAIMQLYEQGLLRLDDSIRHYMPEFNRTWQAIQIQHLLSQRSGVYDYLIDVGADIGYTDMTNQKIIDYFVQHPALEFPPGARAEYSNTAYLLLAEIIARASGEGFSEYMQTHVFSPAGMSESYIADESNPLRDGDALNFADRDSWFGTHIYTFGGSGQVSSTADLNGFLQALLMGRLVSYDSLALMTQSYGVINGRGYGYGLTVDYAGEELVGISREGIHDGYRGILLMDRPYSLEYVILGNGGQRTSAHQANIRRLVELFYGVE